MIYIITGMHRSGTSLMSSFFERNGINMGEKLIGPARGNELGHFEDEGFVTFHEHELKKNKTNIFSINNKLEDFNADYASELLTNTVSEWGWKDPRTVLFIDQWIELMESKRIDYRIVFLYREPGLVMDSLIRRSNDRRLKCFPWLLPRSWIFYNNAILNVKKENKKSILINIDKFNDNPELNVLKLSALIKRNLSVPYSEVYKAEYINKAPPVLNRYYSFFSDLYSDKIDKVYEKLTEYSDI